MENFRILLDLSHLEDRVHKYVWMLISTTELKYVVDLKKAVISKLALNRNDINMFINGGLLLEEEKIMILRENDTVQIQYEKLLDSACHNSSCMEILDSELSLSIGECNGKEFVKHSKKHKRKSKEVSLEATTDIIEKDLDKRKRKRDMSTVDTLETCEDKMLIQVENPMNGNDTNGESICTRKKKKHKKSFSSPSAKDVIIQYERNNIEENKTLPVVSGANIMTADEFYQECEKMEKSNNIEEIITMPVASDANGKSEKIEELNYSNPTDIAVESFIHGSNCKKKKRKRHKKRRLEPNLLGPFMLSNMNSLQKLAKETPPIFEPCDDFAGIRKHVRFTSPTPDNSDKELETVDLETNYLDSKAVISPNKTCISPSAKPSLFPTRKMYIDQANQIVNNIYSKMSSPSNTCTLPNSEISPGATSMTSVDVIKSSPSKTCIKPNTSPVLVPSNPKFGNFPTIKSEIFTPPKQKSVPQNSLTAYRMLGEDEQKSSPEVLKSKEQEPLKPVIHSYADYDPVNVVPTMGSHIAFKMLELDENYSPQVSQYKEGIIKSIKEKTGEIEIQLITVEIKPGRTGKFENLLEDEAPLNEVVQTVTTFWFSLIEPRLISRGLQEK